MRKFGWLLGVMISFPLICVAQVEGEEPAVTENPDEYRDCVVYTIEQADAATAPTGNQLTFTYSGFMTRAEVNNVDCGIISYIDAPSSEGGSGGSNGGGSIVGGGGSSSGNGGGSSGGNSGGTPNTPSQPSNPEPTPTPEPEPEPEPTPEPEPEPEPTPTPTPEPEPEEECHDCYTERYHENKLTGVITPANPKCRDGYQKESGAGVISVQCACVGGWDCDCSISCCKPGCTHVIKPR